MLRRLAVLVLALAGVMVGATPASAGDGPVTCPPGTVPDPVSQKCVIVGHRSGRGWRPRRGRGWRPGGLNGSCRLHVARW